MSQKISLDADDGYTVFEVKSDAGPCEVRLDLFRAYNHYGNLFDQIEDPVALSDAWTEWLATQGFPRLSHGAGFRILSAVKEQVAEIKKNIPGWASPKPASPDSSTSTAAT